jgi:hypothetical protein
VDQPLPSRSCFIALLKRRSRGSSRERSAVTGIADRLPSLRSPDIFIHFEGREASSGNGHSEADNELTGSREFQLAVECCANSFRVPPAIPLIDLEHVDWSRFCRLVRFHRIEGLAWNYLAKFGQLPAPTAERLKNDATVIRARNLWAAAESSLLRQCFEQANIPLVFLKGLTLSALAYGNPLIKSAIDVDVLIDPRDLTRAAEILRACGYQNILPLSDKRLVSWHRSHKESVWLKERSSLQLDLHTRTAENPRIIPTMTVGSAKQFVKVSEGISLPTLATDELFAYLAVHGASSAWFRLKWISDFAALLHRNTPPDIELLYYRSQVLGAARAAGQALLLSDALFGSLDLCPRLRDELNRDRPTRLLFLAALKQLTSNAIEPTERLFGTIAIHWTQFLLVPGLAYKWLELIGQSARVVTRS